MTEIRLHTDVDGEYQSEYHDTVEIMSNGWVKAIDEVADHTESTHYPPHRVMEVNGEVVYYE